MPHVPVPVLATLGEAHDYASGPRLVKHASQPTAAQHGMLWHHGRAYGDRGGRAQNPTDGLDVTQPCDVKYSCVVHKRRIINGLEKD